MAGIWIQRGHALKETGALAEAEMSYRRAAELDPGSGDARLQLGHALKLQERIADAIGAYAEALSVEPGLDAARDELLHLGALDALPEFGQSGAHRAQRMAAAQTAGFALDRALRRWSIEAPRAITSYSAFRRDYPVCPPDGEAKGLIDVLIDARRTIPAQLRTTLLSLVDQQAREWQAVVVAPELADDPVASLAQVDPRIVMTAEWPSDYAGNRPYVLLTEAGAMFDPQAIAWFDDVAGRYTPAGAYADHDAALPDWRLGITRADPNLFPMFDRFFLASTEEPPLMAMVQRRVFAELDVSGPADAIRRAALLAAGEAGPVAHIPRVLVSRSLIPKAALEGEDDLVRPLPGRPHAPARAASERRLTVIVPTRDLPDLLAPCVRSLQARAAKPDRLDILIVDNRSAMPETHMLLKDLAREARARILTFDEPFNWSRANNLAAAHSTGDGLCFVNNDTEMLSDGWDVLFDGALDDPSIGAIGARLLYPDRTIQHAGVLFGIGQGSPIHEGVGEAEAAPGPLARWHVRRQVPAVTGAFLCCSRSAFTAVGGFDEARLPIGFNDIDFCLRLRALSLAIVYEPAIELIHLESKTRGFNRTASSRAWDHGELESFYDRWGDEMFVDPGYNPQWSAIGRPFEGVREPSRALVASHLDRSVRLNPWKASPRLS